VFVNGARVYLPGLVTETNRHPHTASGDDGGGIFTLRERVIPRNGSLIKQKKKKRKKEKEKKNDRSVSCRTHARIGFRADDRPSNPRSIDRNC